ncbi:hypothetical protein [Clostridium sp. D53t1_180928_C8]|uniref:hypothetical protein n=1 Tax=Clostridium sp. D53t1_180928_C8 TaxID=2787101 RepID=UPI0018A91695|nr:hypothetical protein [Clostridium sp. D53t1_180928_C8]
MDKASMRRTLKFIFNSDCLDLKINPSTNNYGLRFYTLFNRIETVKNMPKLIVNQGLVELTANIITPVIYPSRFNNLNTETIIPITKITAIALVVKPEKLDKFLEKLIKLRIILLG